MTCRSGAKFFSEYHSSMQLEVGRLRQPREVGVDDAHPRLLLLAVADELAAEHPDVRVDGVVRLAAVSSSSVPGLWNVSLAQWTPMNPLPAAMASSSAFLPSFGIGGEPSVLFSAVRSPVV